MRKKTVLFLLLILALAETAHCANTYTHNLVAVMLFKKIMFTGTYADTLYNNYNSFNWDLFNNDLDTSAREKLYNAISPEYVRYDLYALAYAVYLATDSSTQGNGAYSKAKRAYSQLNGFLGGRMVPIEDFMTPDTGNQKHKYTHQGWNYSYDKEDFSKVQDNTQRWRLKKEIICSVIRQVFGLTDSKKIDSLGAVLYYSHVLADLAFNSTPDPKDGFLPHTSFVCGELEKHLALLFPNQDYHMLLNEIKKAALESKMPNPSGSDDYSYKISARNALKALLYYFPALLEKESWYRFRPNGQVESPKNARLD
jgi:hypothetical protein